MPTPAQIHIFFTQLQTEKQVFEAFVGLLEEEQGILVNGRKDELSSNTTKKTKALEELQRLSDQRTNFMRTAGISLEPVGLTSWIAGQNPEAKVLWDQCLDLAKRAKRLNDLNGRLLAERLSGNQQAIHTLMTEANQPATYGPDGQTRGLGQGRPLGSA